MATTVSTHAHAAISLTGTRADVRRKTATPGIVSRFFGDLIEDLKQKPLQAHDKSKHDIFREHINAMSISYFALILALIAASLPILAYLITY